jgi:hypothetical protein
LYFSHIALASAKGQPPVAEDHDGRRGFVRGEKVVREAERRSLVDVIDVENLTMATFERSWPVRAVRLSRLGARCGRDESGKAEHRHGGDTAEEAAAGCNVGHMLIDIGHLLLPACH